MFRFLDLTSCRNCWTFMLLVGCAGFLQITVILFRTCGFGPYPFFPRFCDAILPVLLMGFGVLSLFSSTVLECLLSCFQLQYISSSIPFVWLLIKYSFSIVIVFLNTLTSKLLQVVVPSENDWYMVYQCMHVWCDSLYGEAHSYNVDRRSVFKHLRGTRDGWFWVQTLITVCLVSGQRISHFLKLVGEELHQLLLLWANQAGPVICLTPLAVRIVFFPNWKRNAKTIDWCHQPFQINPVLLTTHCILVMFAVTFHHFSY